MSLVLVTGASGYLGSHVLAQTLAAGHTARATLRSLKKADDVIAMMRRAGVADDAITARLSFFVADLDHDAGWAEAVDGCDYVLHVASPMPTTTPKHEDDVIVPARDGALRVLRAARDAGVKRVVLTSSCGAVYYGLPLQAAPFTEADWTNVDGGEMSAYVKSKAIAERAAWDFMAREGGHLELCTINPTGIFGPVLGTAALGSVDLVKNLLTGAMPGAPKLWFAVVDVRDTAALHLLAMTSPAARGERFIAAASAAQPMIAIARLLRAHTPTLATKVPTRELPDVVVRFAARFIPKLQPLLPLLGKARSASSDKARRVLGWQPRPVEETIADTATSLHAFGVV